MLVKALEVGYLQTNCYLVWGENAHTCVVIDPGYAPESILEQVAVLLLLMRWQNAVLRRRFL